MPIYGFRCRRCGRTQDSIQREISLKCPCGEPMVRDYRQVQINGTPAFKPHFNYATGVYVNNDREFRDALKRTSEQNSVATGLDHDYEPRYPGDVKSVPYDDTASSESINSTAKTLHELKGA